MENEITFNDAVKIIAKVPRVSEKLGINIIEHFLADPVSWQLLVNAVDSVRKNGYCVCGNFALDDENKFDGKNLCPYCKDDRRQAILLVPDSQTIQRSEAIMPGHFWYHIVTGTDPQSQANSIQNLVKNIQHKRGYSPLYAVPVVSALGSDTLSQEILASVRDVVSDLFEDGQVVVKSLPVGIPMDTTIAKVGDTTLRMVLMSLQ